MEKTGKYAWGAIAGFVCLYDLLGNDTLTAAFKRGAENPATRPWVYGALGVTALHLLSVIPKEYDPFYIALELPGIRRMDIDKGEAPEVI